MSLICSISELRPGYYELSVHGNTYPVKDQLKNSGLDWDPFCKAWGTEGEAENISIVIGRLQLLGIKIVSSDERILIPEKTEPIDREYFYKKIDEWGQILCIFPYYSNYFDILHTTSADEAYGYFKHSHPEYIEMYCRDTGGIITESGERAAFMLALWDTIKAGKCPGLTVTKGS